MRVLERPSRVRAVGRHLLPPNAHHRRRPPQTDHHRTNRQQGVETPTILASNRYISPAHNISCDCSLKGLGLDARSNAIVSQWILLGGAIHVPGGHLSTPHHEACYRVKGLPGQGWCVRDRPIGVGPNTLSQVEPRCLGVWLWSRLMTCALKAMRVMDRSFLRQGVIAHWFCHPFH